MGQGIKKVLIANRGEIALRILRTCKEMNLKTVAVHSLNDSSNLHVHLADESVCIGPAKPQFSYLNPSAIISAAEITGADAIHPGYGFLSENWEFASLCGKCGFNFIGPSPAVLKTLGNKLNAKAIMKKAGIPVLPGSSKPAASDKCLIQEAERIGYPVILKAVSGGGGRGMKIVKRPSELQTAIHLTRREAKLSFGNPALYLEKYMERSKHVEIQLVGDTQGNVIHLGERDCTVQRRHQKLIEETPCSILPASIREKLFQYAVKAAEALDFHSAGTVEFLWDGHDGVYFIEVNPRIQVEHPVTEMATGIDIVQMQMSVAMGGSCPPQRSIKTGNYSIECRINAENPDNFLPSAGTITNFHAPGGFGIRVDTAVYNQYQVLPDYDSLLLKLISSGNDRNEALKRMAWALDELAVDGVTVNTPFHKKVLGSDTFRSGEYFSDSFRAEEKQTEL